MEEKDIASSHRKTPGIRWWSISIIVIVACLLVASWAIVSQGANKQPPANNRTIVMPKETPQDLYIGYKDVVYRLNARDGSVIWHHPLQQPSKPNRIIGSSMEVHVINNNLIYVALEHTLYVLRGSDGKELWHYAVMLTPAQQAETRVSFMDVLFDKNQLYISFASGEIVALDIQTGTQKWKGARFPNGVSLSAYDGLLYAEEFTANGAPILHAIDGATGQERWHFQREMWGNTSFSPASVVNGILYDGENPLYALDAHTGQKLWEQRMPQRERSFDNLHLINGVLYANTEATIALVGGQEVSPDIYRVFAFEAKTGKLLWHSQPGYQLSQTALVSSGVIVIQSVLDKNNQETLQMLDAKSGTLRWQTKLVKQLCNDKLCSSPLVHIAADRLYVLDDSLPLTFQAFDLLSGKRMAQHPVSIPTKEGIGESLLSNGVLYIQTGVHEGGAYASGSSNTFWRYNLYAVSLADGVTAWQYKIGALLEYQEPISSLLLAP